MRLVLCAIVLSLLTTAATAQVYQAQPNAVLQIQRQNILDGVWRVNGLGDLTLTARPDDVLEGQLAGRACHGQYRGATFALFCASADRGPYILTGVATESPPVATTARSRVFAQPARMQGQILQSYLSSRGHAEEIATLTATRQ